MSENVSRTIIEFVIGGFDTVEHPLTVGFILLFLYILAMLANTANMYFIAIDKGLHQPMYLFICNLAAVDMLYSTSVCPTMIGVLVVGYKTISFKACFVQMFVFHLGTTMEMFAIAVMAFDRLVAIASPLRYHSLLTNLRCVLIIVLLWIVACSILSVMPATIHPLPFCYSTLKYIVCDYAALARATCVDPTVYFNMISLITSALLFGTFFFICLSYLRIVFAVVRMPSNNDKKKMFNTCFSHLLVIICFYAPIFILVILTRIGVVLTLDERHVLVISAFLGPSIVNPFIYCFRTKEIRNKVLRILSKVQPAKN